jgi:transitional endoplasmic reticulum ATPase
LPGAEDREEILGKASRRMKISEELPYSVVAGKTEGWSGAELTAIWTEAALLAIMDDRKEVSTEDFIGGYERVGAHRRRPTASSASGGV